MTAGVVFFTFHTSYPSLWLKLVPSMILSCDKDPTDNEVKRIPSQFVSLASLSPVILLLINVNGEAVA